MVTLAFYSERFEGWVRQARGYRGEVLMFFVVVVLSINSPPKMQQPVVTGQTGSKNSGVEKYLHVMLIRCCTTLSLSLSL